MVLASIVETCFAAVIDCYVLVVGSVEFSHRAYQSSAHTIDPKLCTIKATINYMSSPPQFKQSDPRSIGSARLVVPFLNRTQKSSQHIPPWQTKHLLCPRRAKTNKHYCRLSPTVMSDQKLHRETAGDKECRPSTTNKN